MSDAMQPPADAEPESLDLSGQTIADFRALRKLGQGGMGQVYLAQQISLKHHVALKILRPEMASSPTALARFRAEAEAVARATHPNIVQVYAAGVTDDGVAYMALEFVEGRNLKEHLARKGSLDLPVSLSIMRQVALALQRAAELGIVHRDIKPENILITKKTEVKVADFGLARCLETDGKPLNLTASGVTMGTPLYMSPEQVEGRPVDPRTDIYSFGVTCYQMVSGQPPFTGETPFEVALQHVQKQPAPLTKLRPDLPEALCAVIHKMMAKDPAGRYQTGKDLLRDIARVREGLSGVGAHTVPTPAAPTVALPTPGRMTLPKRWRVVAAAVALTLLLAAGVGALIGRGERPRGGGEVADATAAEGLPLPAREERQLRELIEQKYLKGKPADLAGGFGLCADLAMIYLDGHRLDEAEELFGRLAAVNDPAYRQLGQAGRGIVLALRDKATESNAVFLQVFKSATLAAAKDKTAPALKRLESTFAPIIGLLEKPRWRGRGGITTRTA